MSPRGWTLFLALGLVWGVPYLLIRVAVGDVDPLVVACGRTLIGVLLLLPVAVRRRALGPALRSWPWLLAFTGAEIVGPWFMLGHAETRLTSATAGVLVAVTPIVATVVAAGLGVEGLDGRRLWGLAVGLTGVLALVGLDIDFSDLGAVGAVALTAVGYAIGPMIIARKLADVPPIGVITGSLGIATLVYAPATVLVWPREWTAPAVASIGLLGVLCTAIAFLLFFSLVAEAGPARATVITYLNPAVAVSLGVVVLDEALTRGMLLGLPLVIAGSVLATAPRLRVPDRTPAPAVPQLEPVR
jgi:drug/metabolite transporter (DMT)-like permease